MADIVISEFMDRAAIDEVLGSFDVLFDPSLVDDREALLASLADARAVIVRNRTRVDAELLAAGPRLTVVGRLGVGLDNIDVELCRSRKVAVLPATGANDLAVAEYAITAALVLIRGAWLSTERLVAGEWPRGDLIGREASGRCFGLIGFGSIAREVARRARSLGMRVAACDPYLAADDPAWSGIERVELAELAERCDVVSVHVPLTGDTRHLVDAKLIARMRRGAVLINSARGGVVEERAVIAALKSGRLGGAALDVFETEPLDASAGRAFADVPNLLLTPHVAGVTEESNRRVSRVTAENVARCLRNTRAC